MNTNEDTVILDDVSQGVALYKLSVTDRIKTFPVPHTERRSRNVAFHDGGSTIISGSDHRKVYVFNRRTGDVYDIISTGFKDWVQSIAVCPGFFLVANTESAIDSRSCWNSPDTHWAFWSKYRGIGDPGLGEGGHGTVRQANEEGSLGGGLLVDTYGSFRPFRFQECFGGS